MDNLLTKKLKIFLLLFLMFISCLSTRQDVLDFSGLIRQAYDNRNKSDFQELCRIVNDTIANSSFLWLNLAAEINETSKTIDWGLIRENEKVYYEISDRLILNIDIRNNDIYFNAHKVSIFDLYMLTEHYMYDIDPSDSHITQNVIVDSEIGELYQSRVVIVMTASSGDDSPVLACSDLKLLFECLDVFLGLLEDKRNMLASRIWEKEFENLDFYQKLRIVDIVGYPVILKLKS